jgi:phage N-6-adenine-methyltransferase
MIDKVHFSSIKPDYETPKSFFDEINKEFDFDIDVAASNDNYKVNKYYTLYENALNKKWIGNVWCNPPYGRQIKLWTKKANNEIKIKNSNLIVMLLPSRTDTRWFHEDCIQHEIRFIKGRLKFGNSKDNAPFPSMLVIMKNKD